MWTACREEVGLEQQGQTPGKGLNLEPPAVVPSSRGVGCDYTIKDQSLPTLLIWSPRWMITTLWELLVRLTLRVPHNALPLEDLPGQDPHGGLQ